MGAQLRVYRNRIRSTESTKKITSAMELIAASRIVKAQQRVAASRAVRPAITRARVRGGDLLQRRPPADDRARKSATRAAVLLITSDRGLAGAYSSNVLKEGERLAERLRGEGKRGVPYITGRKGVAYYRFRRRTVAQSGPASPTQPTYEQRQGDRRRADRRLHQGRRRGRRRRDPRRLHAVPSHGHPGARGHPDAAARGRRGRRAARRRTSCCRSTSSSRTPRTCSTRCCRSTSAPASSTRCCRPRPRELAARQRAMKSATDNAEELIKTLHPDGEPGPPGRDHPGDQRDRRRRQRAGLADATTSRASDERVKE